jgi:hypothetical protein
MPPHAVGRRAAPRLPCARFFWRRWPSRPPVPCHVRRVSAAAFLVGRCRRSTSTCRSDKPCPDKCPPDQHASPAQAAPLAGLRAPLAFTTVSPHTRTPFGSSGRVCSTRPSAYKKGGLDLLFSPSRCLFPLRCAAIACPLFSSLPLTADGPPHPSPLLVLRSEGTPAYRSSSRSHRRRIPSTGAPPRRCHTAANCPLSVSDPPVTSSLHYRVAARP